METVLVIAGWTLQAISTVLLIRAFLSTPGRDRWAFIRPGDGPFTGLSMRDKQRLGRLAKSGHVVPSDDAEHVQAFIAWHRRVTRSVPPVLLPCATLVLGLILLRIARDKLTLASCLSLAALPVLLIGLRWLTQQHAARYDATISANGWSSPGSDVEAPDEERGERA